MVRWPAGLHPQAAKRNSSALSWRPGWRGSGQQPIRRPSVTAYTGRITGVPLTGGQVQGTIPGTSGTGSVTSPPLNTLIASAAAPGAGTFTVNWTVTLAGTLASADANNMQLWKNHGGSFTFIATAVNPATAGTYVQAPASVTVAAGDLLQVFSSFTTTPTSGAVYGALLSVPSGNGTLSLSVGPQGLGTIWYPAQVTLSTSTGPLDTSTANVWIGSQGVPVTLVGTVYSGNGTLGLAIPDMSPGQVLIFAWTAGHPGDTAAANVIGTMDALTTG